MRNPHQCQPLTLIQTRGCSADYCAACNVLHLNLEFVSLKFSPDSFAALTDLLNDAQRRMANLAAGEDVIRKIQSQSAGGRIGPAA